jgi:hypothetical protein
VDDGHVALHTTVLPSGHTVGVLSQLSKLQPWVLGVPVLHVSEQDAFWPQSAWQLWSRQVKPHLAPAAQAQLPFEHSPVQVEFWPQSTWHGPALHWNLQLEPAAQLQSPLAQLAVQVEF